MSLLPRAGKKGCAFAFIAALAFLCAGEAHAQATIAGAWVFEATQPEIGCRITGQATIAARDDAGVRRVQLTTHEVCNAGGEWRSTQECSAAVNEGRLIIDCAVVEATPSNYRADDFILDVLSAELMQGELVSNERWATRWRRPSAAPIS